MVNEAVNLITASGVMSEKNEHEILKEWRLDARIPATFNASVWRRIEQQQPSFGTAFRDWLSNFFAKPAAVASYASVAVVIGLAAGQLHASSELRKHENELAARYIQTIDPYAPRPGV